MDDRWFAGLFVVFALLTTPSAFRSASTTAELVGGVLGSWVAAFALAYGTLALWRRLRSRGDSEPDDAPSA